MANQADPNTILLEMQVEELSFRLEREEEAHRKASARATASERRNRVLRSQSEELEGQLRTLEHCWNCPDLGNRKVCVRCANNSVFTSQDGKTFTWIDPRANHKFEIAHSKEVP